MAAAGVVVRGVRDPGIPSTLSAAIGSACLAGFVMGREHDRESIGLSMREVAHTLADSVLLLSAAGGVYCASALAIDAVGPRLSGRARALCWRLVAVKLAGVAIVMVAIAGG